MKRFSAVFVICLVFMFIFVGCSLNSVDKAIEPDDVRTSYSDKEEPENDELDLDKRYANLIEEHKEKGQDYLENSFKYKEDENDNRTIEEKIYDAGNLMNFFNEVVVRGLIDNSRAILIFFLLLAMCSYVFFKNDKARQQKALRTILVVIVFIVVFSFASGF